MKKPLIAACAVVLANGLAGSAAFAQPQPRPEPQPVPVPVPPPPRSSTPPPASPSPARSVQGPPAEELVRQITAGRSFPITVDQVSRLDSVQGHGDTLTYNYTIIEPPDTHEERLQLGQRVRDGIDARACATPDFAKLLEGGYTVVLNYAFGHLDEDIHVRVTPRRCTR